MTRLDGIRRAITDLYLSKQFLAFLLAGGVAMGVNWVVRIILDIWMPFLGAVMVAYCVGMATANILKARFVFPSNPQHRRRELLYFIGFNVAAFPFVLLISYLLGSVLFSIIMPAAWARAVGHLIALASPAVVNFVAHKFITFRQEA